MFPSPNPTSSPTVAMFRATNSPRWESEGVGLLWAVADREASSPPIISCRMPPMRVACTWTNLNQEGSGVPWTNPIRMANPTSEDSRSQLYPVIKKVSGRQDTRPMEFSSQQDAEKVRQPILFIWSIWFVWIFG